jgi:hypothetical protein
VLITATLGQVAGPAVGPDDLRRRTQKDGLVGLRFVVTGTGRCGTSYTADLFTAAGMSCGHEMAFRGYAALGERGVSPRGLAGRMRESLHRRTLGVEGDSSWMAVPRLDKFSGTTFLQLRDPLRVISSFVGLRFFSRSEMRRPRHYAAMHFPFSDDDLLDSMRWWVDWNSRAAPYADLIYRIEDLNEELFGTMLQMVGADPTRARDALATVSTSTNSHVHRGFQGPDLSWDALPPGRERDQLEAAARRFGYLAPGQRDDERRT